MPAPGVIPDDEETRLAALRRYDILDTPPDGSFDRVTALAARLCGTPVSTITIVDHDRIWFKSTCGIEVDEIPRDPGLCASAVMQYEPYVVTDAAIDPRTLDNPLVRGELGLRFYVGVPLTTHDGFNLGTLNVIDAEPRILDPGQLESLSDLAAIVVDELELRLAANRAIESETARQSARFHEQVISGLSHEMRTPLAILGGIVTLEGDEEIVDPERRELREVMRRQVRHLDWLVGQFLDYASLESGHPLRVDTSPVDLAEVVAYAADVIGDTARLTVDIPEGLPEASADRDRSLQILIELLKNAVRFSRQDTPVEVSVEAGDDGELHIHVTDSGPGIEPELVDQLFERFYRGPDSSGSGIGLYVSSAFAEAQGGRIEVDSTPGEGSRFTLVLPRVDA